MVLSLRELDGARSQVVPWFLSATSCQLMYRKDRICANRYHRLSIHLFWFIFSIYNHDNCLPAQAIRLMQKLSGCLGSNVSKEKMGRRRVWAEVPELNCTIQPI